MEIVVSESAWVGDLISTGVCENDPILNRSLLESDDLTSLIRKDAPDLVLITEDERTASIDEMLQSQPSGDVWIFGYGSLIWNPAIKYTERRIARIEGWHRSFCMSIIAGRASAATPGLMLALDEGGYCQGSAFRLAETDVRAELTLLWRREMICRGGYIPRWLELLDINGKCFGHAIAFTINQDGGKYAGNMPNDQAVQRLATASGGLGSCADYLFQTRDGLRSHGIPDAELEYLAKQVEAVLQA
ncbi:cation transport protein ChaC [Ochrobactrum sp. 19YEA23]|uniref:gamma-glutamylcyclotransferase n=1 Tax=Ochrobactrum sp. 19YEA23 TaxID=3039854 RepID=UPI00247A8DBB|nr:cation transport protein ChaC [Ochrobactrum sp. 19YEA23]